MPNIVTYESKSNLTPSDKGINAAADAARHYAKIGSEIGHDVGKGIRDIGDAVERHDSIMEASELYKTGTELKMNLQTRYEQESALPENRGNPHFGDRFMAEIAPLLDAWGNSVQTDHGKQLAVTLKAGIRNEIFNHVAAGQSEMDTAHVEDNLIQTGNMLGSGLITDPSEGNLHRTIGTMENTIQGMTATIPNVSVREQEASQMRARFLPNLVLARYNGVAESIKNQIAETGGETSPALQQLNKDVAAQLGFQYLSPEIQTRITKLGDEAVRQGQALFNSKHETEKSQMIEAGKEDYAKLHNAITNQTLAGQGPTPEMVAAIQRYAQTYGRYNPGEVASLDDYLLRYQQRAQDNTVQPFNQGTRDNIQAGFSLQKGDPRRPTLASLMQAYSHGQITKEDLSGYTTILDKLDKPETDPGFKPAWDSFVLWRNMQVESIGNPHNSGTAAARAAFIHDATNSFMARGRVHGWDHALKGVTDINTPGNFAGNIKAVYQKAAKRPDAGDWLKNNWYQWDANGTATRAHGSTAAPVYPHAGSSSTTKLPTASNPAADLKKADEIIWGKH